MTAHESMVGSEEASRIPERAEDICPILVGQSLPRMVVRNPDGSEFDVNAANAEQPTILIFFRGGWCPYCNVHLGQLQMIESDLVKLGYQILAVSPDRPANLEALAEERELNYRLLSDSEMTAAISLGIAFQVDDETVTKYKSALGADLEPDPDQGHYLLPVPAVFVVGKGGVIEFSYVNPNYKVRLDGGVLLKAAEAAITQTAEIKF
ncbi:MAG: peroxiredoxin-like family protein [Anaerolineae bacterium]